MSEPGTPGRVAKRAFDVVGAMLALVLSSPVLLTALALVWLADLRNPLFIAERIGAHGRPFRFLKIRTMIPDASRSAVDTTILGDPRITTIGRVIRAWKIDELPQLVHVILGEMSLVGPRPNVSREVAIYTPEERGLLAVRPGITDFASIVFADLATTLAAATDANIAYNQLVRPWKSRLGLHYIRCHSLGLDLRLVGYTITALFARSWTLRRISRELRRTGAAEDLCAVVLRETALTPVPPPGSELIVTSRSPESR